MNIPKAIELLKAFVQPGPTALDPKDQAAIKLGIEALKKFMIIRGYPHYQWKALLPGETPQENPLPRLANCFLSSGKVDGENRLPAPPLGEKAKAASP